jgi:CheY-like chemotaxis protein
MTRSLRILCIDDDPHLRDLLHDCLTHFGHQVVVAPGGKAGLELFRNALRQKHPYDIVITDMGMPDLDGHSVARMIKTESPETPIVMLTGWGTSLRGDTIVAATVDVVISKPPRISELNRLLLKLVRPAGIPRV